MLSDEQVKNIMFDIERSEDIFQYKIEGISMYYLLRFSIEIDLRVESLGRNDVQPPNIAVRIFHRLKRFIKAMSVEKNTGEQTSLFDRPEHILESPLIFISPSNYTNHEGYGPHLIDIIEHYYRQGRVINFIQRTGFAASTRPKRSSFYSRYLPYGLIYSDRLPVSTRQHLKDFLRLIGKKTNVDFLSKFDNYYALLVRIVGESGKLFQYIKKAKARYVFTYSVYTEPGILVACRKANAKLVEVQHGVVLDDSIYYQSPRGDAALSGSYLLMPDYILTLGGEWRSILINQRSYFHKKNTLVVGTKKFDKWKSLPVSRTAGSTSRCIVFFSQGRSYNNIFGIQDFIALFLQNHVDQIKKLGLRVVIRPHPNDSEEFMTLSGSYADIITLENSMEVSSLESIVHADFIFAATSMCLYEAIALGKIAISLDKFSGMICGKHVRLVKSGDELLGLIKQYYEQHRSPESAPYLESFNASVLDDLVPDGNG